jgi:hypothetical protein
MLTLLQNAIYLNFNTKGVPLTSVYYLIFIMIFKALSTAVFFITVILSQWARILNEA